MSSVPIVRRSIRGKLDRLVLVSVGVALSLTALLNVWSEAGRYLEAKRETLLATAQVFGAATSKAVAAGDQLSVIQGLRGIARVPGLIRASVEDEHGFPLADLGASLRLAGDLDLNETAVGSPLRLLTGSTVQMTVPVIEGGNRVGSLLLVSDTTDLAGRFRNAVLTATLGSAIALAIGLLLSHGLQRSITRPLLSLAGAMSAVERTSQYVPALNIESDDEIGALASRFNSMILEIQRATGEIVAREEETILRLSRAAEERDDQTGQHIVRVAKVTQLVGEGLGLDPTLVSDLCRASPMHDIGKVSIPDAILFKAGRLDDEERRRMEQHAEAGYRILSGSSSGLVQLAAEIALSHHEHWDGTGYPNRLSGRTIPLSGRITAVADVCDALLTERSYKKAWPLERVKAHLIESAGSHLDPNCVDALVERWGDLESLYFKIGGRDVASPAEAA